MALLELMVDDNKQGGRGKVKSYRGKDTVGRVPPEVQDQSTVPLTPSLPALSLIELGNRRPGRHGS